ncbi:MAG: radical SAM protein [Thermodesulfovibrionia bacterium]
MKWFEYLQQPPARRKKPFYAWQIELTTRCPLKCKMCVREGFKDWHSGDMSYDDFKKLTPYLKDVERVVLEGWGESLLHKNLPEILRLVKAEGPEAGFVTSGKGLDKAYIDELINAGVDFIGFSLSGGSSRTHNSIRVNSDFEVLLEDIKTFNEIKAGRKLKKPKLHIVYLMLMDNIFEIPSLIGIAKSIGIEDIILINLIHVSNEWQEKQRVFTCLKSPLTPLFQRGAKAVIQRGANGEHGEILKEAEIKARELKINLKLPSLSPTEVYVCEENPLENLYISTDGEVAPCVYLYPPVSSPFKRIFCGAERQTKKLSFGNIFSEPFSDIWDKREYMDFRKCFMLRRERGGQPPLSAYMGSIRRKETSVLPKAPDQCTTCHKMLGV